MASDLSGRDALPGVPRSPFSIEACPPERHRRTGVIAANGCCSCCCCCCLHGVTGVAGYYVASLHAERSDPVRAKTRQVLSRIAGVLFALLASYVWWGDARSDAVSWNTLLLIVACLPIPLLAAGFLAFLLSATTLRHEARTRALREIGRLIAGTLIGSLVGILIMWLIFSHLNR